MFISIKYNKLYNKLSKLLTNYWVLTEKNGYVMSECLKKVINKPIQRLFKEIKEFDGIKTDDPLYKLFTMIN